MEEWILKMAEEMMKVAFWLGLKQVFFIEDCKPFMDFLWKMGEGGEMVVY